MRLEIYEEDEQLEKKSESDKLEASQAIDMEEEFNARRSNSLTHVQYLSAVEQGT